MTDNLFDALCEQIPNLLDFYGKDEVYEIMNGIDTDADHVVDDFMSEVWDSPIRRCDVCGKLMNDGYYLDGVYACDDKCRNKHYKTCVGCETDEDAEKQYLEDYADGEGECYYTEWY